MQRTNRAGRDTFTGSEVIAAFENMGRGSRLGILQGVDKRGAKIGDAGLETFDTFLCLPDLRSVSALTGIAFQPGELLLEFVDLGPQLSGLFRILPAGRHLDGRANELLASHVRSHSRDFRNRAVEERIHLVVVTMRDGIELVAVAGRALHGGPQPDLAGNAARSMRSEARTSSTFEPPEKLEGVLR